MRILAPAPIAEADDHAAEAADLAVASQLPTRSVFRVSSVIRVCLTVLTLLAIVAAAYIARPFLLPTCFAIVLALILRPIVAMIERTGLPAGIAAAMTVISVIATVVMMLVLAAPAISDFADQAPEIMRQLDQKISGVKESVAAIKEATDKVENLADPPPQPVAGATQTVVIKQPSLFNAVATTGPAMLAQVAYAVVLALFLLSCRRSLRTSFLRAPPDLQSKIRLARFMRDVGRGVSRYMLATACINVGVAAVAAVALTIIGLPNAIVWGGVMGLASLIPFFGPIVVFIAVGCAALIAFPTVEQALLAPLALIAINLCESELVTPSMIGRQCALNPVVVFFGIAFMAWLWGTVGAFIAVPMLILLGTAARHTPSLLWLEQILTGQESDRPGTPVIALQGTKTDGAAL